ncbi:MAG TPA: site-specific integrase [Phycisphaerae bacterium]|nr:site-specific integrase [Phycisphaerae bacterium]
MASLIKRQFDGGPVWYIQFYRAGKQKRVKASDNFQIAKEKLRQFDSAEARGEANPLPTQTPLAQILTAYIQHIRTVKTAKSAQTDIYYLRDVFGPVCDAVRITSRRIGPNSKKRPPKPGQDRRFKAAVIEPKCFEAITTSDIATFVASRKASRGLAAKTINRYREILTRLFNWAMTQHGVRMSGDKNPAAAVERYREAAPVIHFLRLEQIDQQLTALGDDEQLQAMVATLIYAGLRREELLWLTQDDIDWNAKGHGLIRVRAKVISGESWQPKTRVNRVVPISSHLRPYLDRQRLKSGKGPWFFRSPEGCRWEPDNFSAHLRDTNKKKGLPGGWTNLTFRHTFGSQLAMRGESLYKIATLMGNSPAICQKHYAALIPEALCDCVEFPAKPQPLGAPLHAAG